MKTFRLHGIEWTLDEMLDQIKYVMRLCREAKRIKTQ